MNRKIDQLVKSREEWLMSHCCGKPWTQSDTEEVAEEYARWQHADALRIAKSLPRHLKNGDLNRLYEKTLYLISKLSK